MKFDYIVTYLWHLNDAIEKKKVCFHRERNLPDGTTLTFYTATPGSNSKEFIKAKSIVYGFDVYAEALIWFIDLIELPTPPKKIVKIDSEVLLRELPIDPDFITYDFFTKCKLKRLKVLSETFLKDGRVSVIYARIPDIYYDSHPYFHIDYYLVIGRLVFTLYHFERLVLLEALINSGYLTTWRPELTGKMNYVPKYKLGFYNNHRGKFLKEMNITKSFVTPTGVVAEVYTCNNNAGYCKMVAGDLIYSFKSASDCEIIIDALIANDIRVQPAFNKGSINNDLEIVSARLNRFINADLQFQTSKVCVLQTGSLSGLSTC